MPLLAQEGNNKQENNTNAAIAATRGLRINAVGRRFD